jgi:class 3 adenylate cyclase
LQAIKENNILKMYVDEHVLKFMGGREFEHSIMSSETIDASIVFIDICGFTSISEKISADKVVKLINGYFDVMVKEIINQGGHIDKFMGDAIMAVFRGQYHVDRAVDAAISVRNEIQNLPAFEDAFVPKVSIGVNSGEVVSGNIGSANLKRLDYTVIGDVVNIAQRLQSHAKENQILISHSVYNQVKESFNCLEVGDISVKNKSKELKIYEVIE